MEATAGFSFRDSTKNRAKVMGTAACTLRVHAMSAPGYMSEGCSARFAKLDSVTVGMYVCTARQKKERMQFTHSQSLAFVGT